MQKQILLCWNLIVNSYFCFGYFDCSIDCIYFVVIDFLNNFSCLETVFRSYYYCVYFCLVGFDFFLYIDRMTYLVLCAFEVYSDCLVVFVYIRQNCVRIVGNSYTIS